MPWFRSSLLWLLDALCSFIIARMRVGPNTQLRTQVHCSILVTNCPWKICPHNANIQNAKAFFSSKVPFFAEGRPDGVRKYGKMRPKYGNIRPIWTRPNQQDLKKKAPFFSRPSVHPLKLFQQLAPQDQGEWMCSKPVYIPHKFRNVQMFALAAHSKKQAKVLYFDTNCGSKVVQPKSSGYAPGSEWCVRVPDPILIQHQTGQAQNAHMI